MANLFQNQPVQQGQAEQQPIRNQELLQQIRANPQGYAAQIKANPAAFIKQRFGLDIPENLTNPMQIVQYLYGAPPRRGPGRG